MRIEIHMLNEQQKEYLTTLEHKFEPMKIGPRIMARATISKVLENGYYSDDDAKILNDNKIWLARQVIQNTMRDNPITIECESLLKQWTKERYFAETLCEAKFPIFENRTDFFDYVWNILHSGGYSDREQQELNIIRKHYIRYIKPLQ